MGEMLEPGVLADGIGTLDWALSAIDPKPRDGGTADEDPPPARLVGGRGSPALAATETEEVCDEEPAGVKTAVDGRGGKPCGGAGKVEPTALDDDPAGATDEAATAAASPPAAFGPPVPGACFELAADR